MFAVSQQYRKLAYLISNILYLDIIPKHFQKVNCMFSENRDKTKFVKENSPIGKKFRENLKSALAVPLKKGYSLTA